MPVVTDIKLNGPKTIDAMDLAHAPVDGYTPSNDNVPYLSANHTLPANPSCSANMNLLLTAYAKKNPGKLIFSSSSNSATNHLGEKPCAFMAWQTMEGCGITVACVMWADAGSFVYERDAAVFNKTQAGFYIFINGDDGGNQRWDSVIRPSMLN